MKISSINVYNTSFAARRNGKYVGHHSKKSSTNNVVKTVGGIGLAASTLIGAAVLVPGCNNRTNVSTQPQSTTPSSYSQVVDIPSYDSVIEETIQNVQSDESKTTQNQNPSAPVISTRPQSERKAVWYEVSSGDRLADIVKDYAELDKLTPDEELVPYYNLLEADNPGKWESRDKILIGTRFRVDSIMPENIVVTYPNATQSVPYVQQQIQEDEVKPTEEAQITSPEDQVTINGNLFSFDKDTLKNKAFGDCEGLMYGKFVAIDHKANGTMVMTKHEGISEKTNIAQKLNYDKSGNITSIIDYVDNKPSKEYSYVYRIDCTEETMIDKTAKSGQIDEVKSIYDGKEDKVNSREFFVNGKSVATFDFDNDFVKIGDSSFYVDAGTFACNDDYIGSKRYTGQIEGVDVRIDVLKTGFCFEILNSRGEISSREQYDAKGNFLGLE